MLVLLDKHLCSCDLQLMCLIMHHIFISRSLFLSILIAAHDLVTPVVNFCSVHFVREGKCFCQYSF